MTFSQNQKKIDWLYILSSIWCMPLKNIRTTTPQWEWRKDSTKYFNVGCSLLWDSHLSFGLRFFLIYSRKFECWSLSPCSYLKSKYGESSPPASVVSAAVSSVGCVRGPFDVRLRRTFPRAVPPKRQSSFFQHSYYFRTHKNTKRISHPVSRNKTKNGV